MKVKEIIIVLVATGIGACLVCSLSYADEIILKNQDKVTGKIVNEGDATLDIETEAMGVVSVNKDFIEALSRDEDAKVAESLEPLSWEKELSLGYDKTTGNTQSSQLSTRLFMHRKTKSHEFHFQADSYYSSSDKKMDSQQWNVMGRYAYSLANRKWYHFYKLLGTHDRFANINYRIIPSTGLGYWFSDQEDFKAMLELAGGFEYTNYGDSTKSDSEAVLIPRAYLEKAFASGTKISQDITLYPSLEDTGSFRMHWETALTRPLSDKLSMRFSFIHDYDSDPAADIKKSDFKFISSLIFSF